MNKRLVSSAIVLLYFFISSYGFSFKTHEICLLSLCDTIDYNHYSYYFMLDTIKSQINVYRDDYGKVFNEYSLKICPDSSIVFNTKLWGNIRFAIKNGLIRKQIYTESGGIESYVYDANNHLVSILYDRDKTDSYTFAWKNDSLLDMRIRGVSKESIQFDTQSPAVKSPELFCRLYTNYGFNELLFSALGLYGEFPLTPASYSIIHESCPPNSEKPFYISKSMVNNIYTVDGLLLQSTNYSNGHIRIRHYYWYMNNMKRAFDFIKK